MARIAPLAKAEWPSDITEFIAAFQASVRGDRPPVTRPGGVNLLGTLVRYPELAKPFLTFNGHFLYGNSLSPRHRELLILRVAALRHCDYEWAQHTLLAGDAGLSAREIEYATAGPDTPGWAPPEQTLLRAADELIGEGSIGGGTWKLLAAEFDEKQLMDVVFTVATYEMVAMMLRSFDIDPEPDLIPHLPVRE